MPEQTLKIGFRGITRKPNVQLANQVKLNPSNCCSIPAASLATRGTPRKEELAELAKLAKLLAQPTQRCTLCVFGI